MTPENSINESELKELLHYDPETGIFTWYKKGSGRSSDLVAGIKTVYGYIDLKVKGVTYKAHRLAWLYMYGVWPERYLDHINHVRHDNRIVNLRDATRKDNSKNISMTKNNTSGIIGVRFDKQRKKWHAYVRVEGKLNHLIFSNDKFEAICVRKSAERKHGFHENHGRQL